MTHTDQIRVGSLVQIGAPAPPSQKAVWTVRGINQAAEGVVYAALVSKSAGQYRTAPIDKLTLFRLTEVAV